MKQYDWNGTFPDIPEKFHNVVVETLNVLPEDEENNSMEKKQKRYSWKKTVIIAAAAVLVLGTSAFAAGKITSISGSSSSIPTYRELPEKSEISRILKANPKMVEAFTNGYEFKSGHIVDSTAAADNGEIVKKYKNLLLYYHKGADEIYVDMHQHLEENSDRTEITETFQGVDIEYYSYTNKFVPGDYVMTEQDKADEAAGKYVFSYGVELPETVQIQGVIWTDQGMDYCIGMQDSELTKEDIISMAKEIIQAE